ncbi:hypothetical protein GpSGHVEth147 [Glossina pallidipes salivary gland hypertrophy virus]|uniref:Uncharacterized protein n=2 Tax=Glossina hytrovirus (isolate Glossina pallidipes/Ethiopia/Seibersdorf/-) TaxID=379529 RepID=A0A0Y0KG05_GHVS|nr:hypothetical protein SGHV132 [Glossina pallidipes salivary gland hypertrophy virus]ABQ08905.1 hypothetical protein SGHV132 [Glossina pallidipes salivary gland hypertrophy virus]AMB48751.1 hypothetical protein GpSGHVEth147 [Glossina pallidipes salivary gland hypertrophy virus]
MIKLEQARRSIAKYPIMSTKNKDKRYYISAIQYVSQCRFYNLKTLSSIISPSSKHGHLENNRSHSF